MGAQLKVAKSPVLILAISLHSAAAQSAPLASPGDVTLSDVELLVDDVASNRTFWTTLGGTPFTTKDSEGAAFGDFRIFLSHSAQVPPAADSGLNHIGLHVPDVQKAIDGWKAQGLKTQPGRNPQQAYVWSPGDLIQVEMLEDATQKVPETFHHVHIYIYTNAAGGIPEAQAWYIRMFGATAGTRGNFAIDTLPGGELSFARANSPTALSIGHAIDHVGFTIKDVPAYCRKLAVTGIVTDTPCTGTEVFLSDPWGNRIALHQAGASRSH